MCTKDQGRYDGDGSETRRIRRGKLHRAIRAGERKGQGGTLKRFAVVRENGVCWGLPGCHAISGFV